MKINSIGDNLAYFNRVSEKHDSQKESSGHDHSKDRQNSDSDLNEIDADSIATAIESFAQDQQALAQGLSAASIGSGPGLRVVLKDGSGAVIRQMTGDEFVRLRDTLGQKDRGPGKLLDQKW